ncbi:MAG: FGGY-family carbohydrate kinase [Gammaproteobacteria bacterium]|nr:FGGY-family carbohydrate kinase [Gammaproteobacteria bacterium]
MPLYLGIDLGTSACRVCAIDPAGVVRGQASAPLPVPRREGDCVEQNPALWWQAATTALQALLQHIPAAQITALATDGTSGTLLLCNAWGEPLADALMYNDARSVCEASYIDEVAPAESGAHGPSSALAKLMHLQADLGPRARYALTPADWIAFKLGARLGVSDEHNCLKLGYDVIARRWPDWLSRLGVRRELLPEVVAPGTDLGPLNTDTCSRFGFRPGTCIVAGTTDSTAAFIATGARKAGEAVTSLGSTLVMKVLSERPIFAPRSGVYSHRLGDLWLAGAGSNSGGAVLRHFFSPAQITTMTPRLHPERPTGLDYYPLIAPGERFPVSDPALAPRLHPRPADDLEFFQGMLEGMAQIEQHAYQLLAELGAPYPVTVRSVGGGAANAPWRDIRARLLGVPLLAPTQHEAAYGAALLALRGTRYLHPAAATVSVQPT